NWALSNSPHPDLKSGQAGAGGLEKRPTVISTASLYLLHHNAVSIHRKGEDVKAHSASTL
ncbi:MAG: hypothetical protein KAX26_12430, partial [Anaerolineae bacterium]|nr:hypothetical protein [Anaerolineae bacterium]